MKRFTETIKWRDPWYRRLSPAAKLLFLWLADHCDNAGVIDIDLESAAFDIGESIEEKHVIELGDRLQRLPCGKWHMVKFVAFQFGNLRPGTPIQISIHRLYDTHGIGYVKGIDTVSIPPIDTPQEQDKEQDKEQEQEGKGGVGERGLEVTHPALKEFSQKLATPRLLAKWQVWMTHRRAHKKPKSWPVMFNEQIEWLEGFDEPAAFEILSASIRNGWTGLFEPKGNYGNSNAKTDSRRPSQPASKPVANGGWGPE